MSDDQGTGFEWRRKRGWLNRTIEKVEELPANVLFGGRAVSDSAKRKLYEQGLKGQALILEAPGRGRVSQVSDSIVSFRVRIDVPGRESYETKVTQTIMGGHVHDSLQKDAMVECRVDRKDASKVLLIPPEIDELKITAVDSSDILAKGKRATARIERASMLDVKAPGSGDPMYELVMEMRSDAEPEPWAIRIGQRVPAGAEKLVKKGGELTVAYIEVDDGHSAAVDWPASTGGRFS
jgi:hypothetical protein